MRQSHTLTLSRRPPRRLSSRSLLPAAIAVLALVLAPRAHAQEDGPAHMLARVSIGAPMRLTLDKTLDQSRFAPAFGNVLLGYALPGGSLRHGFGVGVSWNLGHDGGYTTPVYAADQIALMPSYLLYYALNRDVFAVAHAGVPILVRGGPVAGLELGALIAYRVFAGSGVFAALNVDGYGGLGFNVLASLELGIVIDYEVLP
jgi:hypothetical protein